jgi:hypothetical protein
MDLATRSRVLDSMEVTQVSNDENNETGYSTVILIHLCDSTYLYLYDAKNYVQEGPHQMRRRTIELVNHNSSNSKGLTVGLLRRPTRQTCLPSHYRFLPQCIDHHIIMASQN